MSTISEIAARMEQANEARAFRLRELQRAAQERLKISARDGEVGHDADEMEADLNESNVGHEGEEFPERPVLNLGPTFGMDEKEAEVVAAFTKDCRRVSEAMQAIRFAGPATAEWWKHMRTQMAEGKFLETREEIYKMGQRYPSPHGDEKQYVEALERVYNRL